jgi:L-fuculose-phosphate aldolase
MLSPIPALPDRRWPMPTPPAPTDEAGLRGLVSHVARQLHQFRYVSGAAGSVSARVGTDDRREHGTYRLLITPSGVAKSLIQPDQLVMIGPDGTRLSGQTDAARSLQPDDELGLHLECYGQRPELLGIVHAHPPIAVALTMAGVSLRTCLVPEAVVILGVVPTTPYALPNSPELAHAIRVLISQHDAILLAAHGSLTVGADVWQAYLRLETLEHTATIVHHARQLGPLSPLSPAQVAELLHLRRKLGYWREGDDELFCEACGVC